MDDPGWDPATSMTSERAYFTATLLQNGKVFVAGGFDGTDLLFSTETYDPFTNVWDPSDSLGGVRETHTATLLRNGRVLIAGGDDGYNYLDSVELYDPGTGMIAAPPMHDKRENHTATLLSDGKVLVVGGFGYIGEDEIILDTAEVYDPADDSWTAVAPMGTARVFHTASLLTDGTVLVVGGRNEEYQNGIPSAQIFDPADGSWGEVLPLSGGDGRLGHTATVLPDGKVLVAGGFGRWCTDPEDLYCEEISTGVLNTAKIFDPTAGTFSPTDPMTDVRQNHTATLLPNGQVLVTGGTSDGSDALESTELFDPSVPSWSSGGSMDVGRYFHPVVLLPNGKVLVSGGVGAAGPQDLAELYAPPTAGPYSGGTPSLGSLNLSSICLGADYLEATGSGFQGLSECSGGNGGQNSSTNYPLLQIRSLVDSTNTYLLGDPAHLWSDTTFRSVVIDAGALTPGGAQARIVTNGIASDPISITINAPPSVNSGSPADPPAICSGATATLTVTATGTGLSYQWYRGTAPDTTDPVGTDSSSYTTATLTSTTAYWVRVTGSCGTPLDSRTATVTVRVPASISVQPASTSVCSGDSGTTLSVTAAGDDLSYQWYEGTAPDDSVPVGTDSESYATGTLSSTKSFWVRVSGSCESQVDSSTATVTVNQPASISSGTPSDPTAICAGTTATLTVSASGAGLNYQWYRGTAPDTTNPVGTNSNIYTTASLTSTTACWVRVTGTCAPAADSRTATVTVNQPASISLDTPSDPTAICAGTTATLTVSASGAGLNYQWYRGTAPDTTNPVGTNSNSYTTATLTSTTAYWVQVTGTCGSPQDSRTATVTVNQPANITSQPESAPVCSGSGTTLSVTATGYNLSYQWYQGAAPSTATPVGTNSNSYDTGNLSSTTSYWVRVTGGCGSPADSGTATVTVNANTSITSGSPVDPAAICTGTTATLTVAATGSGLNYQWYRGTAPSTTDPVGTDSSSYTTATLSATTPYWVRVTGSCGTADSRTVTVTVIPAPAPTISGASANMCPSTTVDLSTQGGMTDYQWYVDTILIEGATSSSHTATASGTYTVSYSNGCGTGTSAGHAVTVTGCAPPPETAPGNTPATAQSWSGKTTITWPVNSGATSGYHVYRGVKADLPNLLGGGTDSCTRATTPDASSNSATGIEEVPSGVAGRFYWYLITGLNWTEGTAGNATAGERTLNSSGACP
jgi:hypothetical protein